jgi:colanic acid/amylovoran biosynthesis glycosyltransferase
VGRPHWIKGYVYALDACKILKNHKINFTYTIIGGANLELIYQINELELNHNVTLIDHVPFERVQELMQKSDVLLLPSNAEGLANVVLEAMALETLVLTTACGGMDEVIQNDVNGYIIPIRDVEKMANKLIEITALTISEKRILTDNAKEIVKKQHTENKMISEMLEFYNHLK